MEIDRPVPSLAKGSDYLLVQYLRRVASEKGLEQAGTMDAAELRLCVHVPLQDDNEQPF